MSEVIINEVKVNKDISTARIYFNILNSKNNKKHYEQLLKKATGFIKKEIMNEFGQWLLEINVTSHYLERLLDKQGVSLLWKQKPQQSQLA